MTPADPLPPWSQPLRRQLARASWNGVAPHWLVAVSGGGDSVALLRILHNLSQSNPLYLTVAHLDHGARGPEASRADAQFVTTLAANLGLPLELGRWQPTRTAHFEADARRARLQWLAETAARLGASAVLTGHTLDDQAETILHRIFRGTGPKGFAGIPSRRPLTPEILLLRPLLKVYRAELRDYLRQLNQSFRDDPTNADTTRTRARLRHELLPKLAQDYNPAITKALAHLGQHAAKAQRALQRHLATLEPTLILARTAQSLTVNRPALRKLSPAWRTEFLRRVWNRQGWPESAMTAQRWQRLTAAITTPPPTRLSLGAKIELTTTESTLTLTLQTSPDAPIPPIPLPIPGSAPWLDGQITTTLNPTTHPHERIDANRLSPPLTITSPAPGDRFDPLGLQGHTQPLADFLRNQGIPRVDRPRIPLIRDTHGIIWVVGHRIADRVRITPQTTQFLGLSYLPKVRDD